MHYYLISRSPTHDTIHATFERLRCALSAARRRPRLVLVASSAPSLQIGQRVPDWLEWEGSALDPVDELPEHTQSVEQLPESFGPDWWQEYVS